jgi:hypothetical protein
MGMRSTLSADPSQHYPAAHRSVPNRAHRRAANPPKSLPGGLDRKQPWLKGCEAGLKSLHVNCGERLVVEPGTHTAWRPA